MIRLTLALLALMATVLLVASASAQTAGTAPRPNIVWKPIPFGPKRIAQTRAYMKRHYGLNRSTLVGPHVIVEHYTAVESFTSVWNGFARDVPDSELHELPGTCAQFVIAKNGTIYQLVKLPLVCRHTVGLNWTAIGIEHVGMSDQEVLHDRKQMASSLELTLWLASRYHIPLDDIIGHNESLQSPYHRERYAAWRCQTHQDWKHADMNIYRHRLAQLALSEHVPLQRRDPNWPKLRRSMTVCR